MNTPYLVSIQVGKPQRQGVEGAENPMDRAWYTGFFKTPVTGKVWLGRTNLEGDGQADRRFHGGRDKAVLAYAHSHYAEWCKEWQIEFLPPAAFGENFTMAFLDEQTVCIGDIFSIGEARIQACQPRVPCWKQERRLKRKGLVEEILAKGRSGWYYRVLQEGEVEVGMEITLMERSYPEWTIARTNEIMHHLKEDTELAGRLSECTALASGWRKALANRAGRMDTTD